MMAGGSQSSQGRQIMSKAKPNENPKELTVYKRKRKRDSRTNTSTSTSVSTTISSSTSSPSPFPNFSLSTKKSASMPSSQLRSTTSAMFGQASSLNSANTGIQGQRTMREFEAATSFQDSELNRIFPDLCVCVDGFLVPRAYVELYRKILRRYGHIATTQVLTDCPLGLVGVATEVMRLFEEMASCTQADLSEDLLRRWSFRLSSAESLKFKVDWLRQRLEEVKFLYRRQIENNDAIEAARSSLVVTESKLTAVIARRKDHLKEKQAAEASLKAAETVLAKAKASLEVAETAVATVNATLEQDDEEISIIEAKRMDRIKNLRVVESYLVPITLVSDLL